MSTRKKVLWVVPKFTFPVSDGARVASNSLVQSCKRLDLNLDVLCFVEEGDPCNSIDYKVHWGALNTYLIERISTKYQVKKILFWLLSLIIHPMTPLTVSYFNTTRIKSKTFELIKDSHYDYIVFDGLHSWAPFRKLCKSSNTKIIYRAHNVERDLWSTAASKTFNPILKIFYLFQGALMEQFEAALINRAEQTWAISCEDKVRFQNIVPKCSIKVVPVGMNFTEFIQRDTDEDKIKLFFLGRLDWPPNRDGLRWFLEKVWSKISTTESNLELHIGGSGDGSWLDNYSHMHNIVFHGLIDDLDKIYKKMDLGIMPIFYGSGTRIKVIESARYGLPMLTTQMGVQGSGLCDDEYLNAETAQEWIATLSTLDSSILADVAQKAWYSLKEQLDYDIIAKDLSDSLIDSYKD